ncbi:MAG: hypothetical protein AB1697_05465 [Pseudomonadota bacterium]
MKTTLIALLVGTFFAGSAIASDKACYSYTDYESANNSQAMCLGSVEFADTLAAKVETIVVAEYEPAVQPCGEYGAIGV